MDIRTIEKPIKQFIQAIPKNIYLDKAIIFGSYANQKATKDSDVDIVLVSENFKKMSEDDRLDILYKASRFIEPDIHPWGVTQDELNKADSQSTLGMIRVLGKVIKI